ncbi:MAG: hypothetical protein LBU23_01565 [Planctomycetota bacterium]|jgi:hypothetical protein|nr:hypothetical protein [Planctomycetota bacterium]
MKKPADPAGMRSGFSWFQNAKLAAPHPPDREKAIKTPKIIKSLSVGHPVGFLKAFARGGKVLHKQNSIIRVFVPFGKRIIQESFLPPGVACVEGRFFRARMEIELGKVETRSGPRTASGAKCGKNLSS